MSQTWLCTADFHAGATTGLTSEPTNDIQCAVYDRYQDCLGWAGEVDRMLVIGDGQDGSDPKGRDIDEHCLFEQARRVAELMAEANVTQEYIYISGTPYHKDSMDFERHTCEALENILARTKRGEVKVTFRRKLKTTSNGWFRLEARHKIGASRVPYCRNTAPGRAKTWQVLNAALSSQRSGEPAAWPHLMMYGHVHYYAFAEDAFGATMTVPSWQAIGSKYGDEECEGHIDLGAVVLEVGDDEWTYRKRLYAAGVVDRTESR